MSSDGEQRRNDIRTGQSFPTASELEAGMPFYRDSIRQDMIAYAESSLRRLAELEALDESWSSPSHRVALEALRDAAADDSKTDAGLPKTVRGLMDVLPTWTLGDWRRCQVYLADLAGKPGTNEKERYRSTDLNRHPTHAQPELTRYFARLSDLLTGKAYPDTHELLCGMPFYHGSMRLDMHTWALRLLRRVRAADGWNAPPDSAFAQSLRLLRNVSFDAVPVADLLSRLDAVMEFLPEDDRDGRLRCRIYQAALGDREAQLDLACTAVSLALHSAELGEPIQLDFDLARGALGWLATAAGADEYESLAGSSRPKRSRDAAYDAFRHGQFLVGYLRTNDPSPKGDDPDTTAIKRLVICKGHDFLTEIEAADRLGVEPRYVLELASQGSLIGVPYRSNRYYPDFQFVGSAEILPGLWPTLRALPFTNPWRRLEWLLTPLGALAGITPLEALRDGRVDDVRMIAAATKPEPDTRS
jgi:hypothetical protein